MLLECPAYSVIRGEEGFEQETSMLRAMEWDPARLARMLERIWLHRNSVVPFGR